MLRTPRGHRRGRFLTSSLPLQPSRAREGTRRGNEKFRGVLRRNSTRLYNLEVQTGSVATVEARLGRPVRPSDRAQDICKHIRRCRAARGQTGP